MWSSPTEGCGPVSNLNVAEWFSFLNDTDWEEVVDEPETFEDIVNQDGKSALIYSHENGYGLVVCDGDPNKPDARSFHIKGNTLIPVTD